jgi:hypothetical protein
VKFCTLATLGDAGIALVAFWTVAATGNSRSWIHNPTLRQVLVFAAVGLLITLAAEWLATELLDRWRTPRACRPFPSSGPACSPCSSGYFCRRLWSGLHDGSSPKTGNSSSHKVEKLFDDVRHAPVVC